MLNKCYEKKVKQKGEYGDKGGLKFLGHQKALW